MNLTLVRYSERPELWETSADVSSEVWPEYNLHGDVMSHNFGRIFDAFPDFQFALYDDTAEEVVAEGHSAPCAWDGTTEGLLDGIDDMLLSALAQASQPTALCALAAEIRPPFQGLGLASRMLDAMAELGRQAGLAHLIAPVRPSLKERYPLAPIEQYVRWTREDGEPFDPWIRVHTRRGGRLTKPVPRSMHITGTVAEWERWTDLRYPADGDYVFPRGLAPLTIDRSKDLGDYWEPNIWIVHEL
jgi:GNAT superfamily N-acetyltransferase